MKGKYYPAGGLLNSDAKNKDSWMWKSWIGAKQILQKGFCYEIGNGKSVWIWEAPWIKANQNFKPQRERPTGCDLTWASELMQQNGRSWNVDLIRKLFTYTDAAPSCSCQSARSVLRITIMDPFSKWTIYSEFGLPVAF